MLKKLLFALLVVSPFALASQLMAVSPVQQTLSTDSDVLDLGVFGPGQTIEIITSRETGEIATTSSSQGQALWDRLFVLRGTLPTGWKAEDSKLFEKSFHAFITAAPDAADGEYSFQLRAIDQYEGASERVFKVKVSISKDLLLGEASPTVYATGVGLPAVFQVRLRNRSSASDVFEISATGVPGGWKETRRVLVRFHEELIEDYEILPSEQGEFKIALHATSLSSKLINAKSDVVLVSRSSLEQDLKALNKGILLFPSVEQVVYSALGLAARIFLN